MGLFSSLFGDNGAEDALRDAKQQYREIDLPDIDQMKLQLQQYVDQGVMTPEEAKAQLVNSNAYDSMNLDSEGKQAQLAALHQLSDIGNNGGMTAQDKSQLQQIQNEEQTKARGARDAIVQNADARGVGGSGLSELAQLQNAQDAATRQSSRDLDVAAQGQQRALQALQSAGQLGGNINQQQFGQQQAVANSKNEIAKFNAQNQQQTNLVNTAANNQAQTANLANKQAVSNANVDTANKQQVYNNQLPQQNFQNQLQKAGGIAGADQNLAGNAQKDKDSDKGLLGSAIGGVASLFSDERVKKDVEKFDAGQFLDGLTGYKYKYKDPSMGKGKQVGVMAQDIEKEVPEMVKETSHGKMVDYSPEKVGGPILASLAHIHDRLKKIEGK